MSHDERAEGHGCTGHGCPACAEEALASLKEDLSVARQSLYEVVGQRNDALAVIAKLKRALNTLARWQIDHAPHGDGDMCDFAENALKEVS